MQEKKKKIIVIVLISIIILLLMLISLLIFKVVDYYKSEDNKEITSGIYSETTSGIYTETINSIPLEVTYNEEKYVIEGLPKEVNITFGGKKKTVKEIAKEDHKIKLDLSEYEASEDWIKIKLDYNIKENVDYKIEPSTIKIKIENKESLIKKVDLENKEFLNSIEEIVDEFLVVQSIKTDRENIIIKGSASSLKKVETIIVKFAAKDFKIKEAGQYTFENIPLIALDKKGNPISNIEIVSKELSINLVITEQYNILSKTIKKNIVMKNLNQNLQANLLSTLDTEIEIKVKGTEEALNSLKEENIDAYVDLKDLKVGEYELPVKVEWRDKNVKCEGKKTIKIKLTEKEK